MKSIKNILIGALALFLGIFTVYMMFAVIDEKIQNRMPETTDTEPVKFQEIETEAEETHEETETEVQTSHDEQSDAEVSESDEEIQQIVEEVPNVYVEADPEPLTEYTEPVVTGDAEIAALAQTLYGECGSGTNDRRGMRSLQGRVFAERDRRDAEDYKEHSKQLPQERRTYRTQRETVCGGETVSRQQKNEHVF